MNSDQPAGQTVEELLQAAVDAVRAMVDQECRLKHTQGPLLGEGFTPRGLAASAIERAVAAGWIGDAATGRR